MKKMILAIALLASAGCATSEKQFTDDEVSKLKKCIKTNELLYLNGH